MTPHARIWVWASAAGLAAAALTIALRPTPIPVETSVIATGPLQVTTDELGETRSHDRYVVAAPIAGRLLRVPLREGDAVVKGELVAVMAPLPLSARERDELTARVAAAEANERSARAQLAHVLEDLKQARRESDRLEKLYASDATSRQDFEQAQNATRTLESDVDAARNRAQSAAADLEAARAGLVALAAENDAGRVTVTLRAPSAGRVLRIVEPSERVLGAGSPVVVIGDLEHLEAVLEMLSSEAVKVAPGMPALLKGWGGEQALRARVRMIEPYAFTKISALGVEEKRTRVVLDFVDPPGVLGDGYRVTGSIVLWSSPSVLKSPLSALYRCGSGWCVFVVEQSRARRRDVQLGHRNEEEAEILEGLKAGDEVIRHPPNELADGTRVQRLR